MMTIQTLLALMLLGCFIFFVSLWVKNEKNFMDHVKNKDFEKKCIRYKNISYIILFILSVLCVKIFSINLSFWVNHVATIYSTTVVFVIISVVLKVLTHFNFFEVLKEKKFSSGNILGVFIGFSIICMLGYSVIITIEKPIEVKEAYEIIFK